MSLILGLVALGLTIAGLLTIPPATLQLSCAMNSVDKPKYKKALAISYGSGLATALIGGAVAVPVYFLLGSMSETLAMVGVAIVGLTVSSTAHSAMLRIPWKRGAQVAVLVSIIGGVAWGVFGFLIDLLV